MKPVLCVLPAIRETSSCLNLSPLLAILSICPPVRERGPSMRTGGTGGRFGPPVNSLTAARKRGRRLVLSVEFWRVKVLGSGGFADEPPETSRLSGSFALPG